MSQRYRSVLLVGPPGVGKGTQGAILGHIPGFFHMASGDMFRSLDKQSELGRKFFEFSSKGLLVPDDLTVELWQQYMKQVAECGKYDPQRDLLLLDGIPRSVAQVDLMKDHVDVLCVVHLTTPDIDQMVIRMKKRAERQSRHDDADENVIRKRFEVYKSETAPLLAKFTKQQIHDVNAMGTPIEVLRNILNELVPIYQNQFGNPLD